MVTGIVTDDGTPVIEFEILGRSWPAIVDTGFNGYLELPDVLRSSLRAKFLFETQFVLAAGQTVVEELYEVEVSFDGSTTIAEATFVPGSEILLGTAMLRRHRLEINFQARTVLLERV